MKLESTVIHKVVKERLGLWTIFANAFLFLCRTKKQVQAICLSLLFLNCITSHSEAAPYEVGEKLTYHFYYGPFMVGRGTFEVVEQKKDKMFQFKVTVKSNGFISNIYPVEDEMISFFDPVKKRSLRFIQDRNEGSNRTWEETFFFYSLAHGQTISYKTGEMKWFEIPANQVQDKLSTIYYMRGLNWNKRAQAEVVLGNDKKNYDVKITKLNKEILATDDFLDIPTFEVQPNMEYLGGFVKKGTMNVWVSNDTYKVPIKVVAHLSVGTVSAVLVKVEGIKDWPYDKKN